MPLIQGDHSSPIENGNLIKNQYLEMPSSPPTWKTVQMPLYGTTGSIPMSFNQGLTVNPGLLVTSSAGPSSSVKVFDDVYGFAAAFGKHSGPIGPTGNSGPSNVVFGNMALPPPSLGSKQLQEKANHVDCVFCHGTTRVSWNPIDLGPEPPPDDWPKGDPWLWGFSEAHSIDCPKCTLRGWGKASNEPWYSVHTAVGKAIATPFSLTEWFALARTYVIEWYRTQITNELQVMKSLSATAERNYFLLSLMRTRVRALAEPDWDYWANAGQGYCPKCNSGNFAPTLHPRTHWPAIGCCECSSTWVTDTKPVGCTQEARDRIVLGLRRFGFSNATVDSLFEQYHTSDLANCLGLPLLGGYERFPEWR